MLDVIRDCWSWAGLNLEEIIAVNAFGNLVVRATDGWYWRICPEELSCEPIAKSEEQMQALFEDEDFLLDWEMTSLVEEARACVGELPEGHRYCFKILPVIGGEYGGDNLGSISLRGLLAFCGEFGEQIKDLPDGTQISQIRIVD